MNYKRINFIRSEMEMIGHQKGWRVASDIIQSQFHNYGTNFFSWLDRELYLRSIKQEWTGILHNVVDYPDHYSRGFIHPLRELVEEPNFKSSLSRCLGLYTLSDYTTEFIRSHVDVPVETLYHPKKIMPLFDYKKFIKYRKICHIGQWMRNYDSFVGLKLNETSKHLIGCDKWHYDRIRRLYGSHGISIIPRLEEQQYELLFTDSIFFLDLYDVSACNVILECISSNAPLIVKRLPAAEQYLGKDYPLFYSDTLEAQEIIDDDRRILDGHVYLLSMDKSKFEPESFAKSISESGIYKSLPSDTKRPLFRWTLGHTCDKGYDILKHSIAGAMKCLGPESFDWAITYNRIPEDKLFYISRTILADLPAPVCMIEQCEDDMPIPHILDASHNASTYHHVSSGSWWKVCPPRLRIDAHELIMDNDVVMLRANDDILRFLQDDSTLVLEDNSIHLGRYASLFDLRNEPALNSGLIGLPPAYDFGKALYETWINNGQYQNLVGGDEQGLLTATLKRQKHITIPRSKVIGLHPHKLALEAVSSGLLHFNVINHQAPNSSLDYKYRFWIDYEDIDIDKLMYITDAFHFYQMNLNKPHRAWNMYVEKLKNMPHIWFE